MFYMKLRRRFLFLLLLCLTVIVFLVFTINRGTSVVKGSKEVEGWHPNRSRNVRDYVSEYLEPHALPRAFCVRKNQMLLVMIMSKPNNFQARRTIRETWAQKRVYFSYGDNVTFVFLLGESKDFIVQIKLNIEIKKFDDIIQENFIDHYNNLTIKTVNMLKLFNKYCCNSYKYLMKVDDDVFLNVASLMEMLMQRTSATNVLMGKLVKNTWPYRDPSSKWYVPYEWYPKGKYPQYLCGISYIMSSDVARKLYHCTFETPLFYIEDVYLTGMCAKKIKVVPQDNTLFRCLHLEDVCQHKHLFVFHLHSVKAIQSTYRIITNNECQSRTRWQVNF